MNTAAQYQSIREQIAEIPVVEEVYSHLGLASDDIARALDERRAVQWAADFIYSNPIHAYKLDMSPLQGSTEG